MDGSPQERILDAALRLLDEGGVDAVSTRAVGELAHVQAPAIYRLFGDKQGLLDAAVERGYAEWVAAKGERPVAADPVAALREGWDDAVAFGVDHPAMYRIASGGPARSAALAAGYELLAEKIRRVADAGRLRLAEEQALALMQAAARGVTLTLIDAAGTAPGGLSAEAREAVIAAIALDAAPALDPGPRAAAAALRARLPQDEALTAAERALLDEWLARMSRSPQG